MAVLLDTGPFAMLLMNSTKMTAQTRARLRGETLLVPSIAFFEIAQKVRIGKWDQMAPFVETLEETAIDDGFEVIPLTAHLALKAALLDWNHRDPFDRMIAATALQERVQLVSSDRAFDAVGVERVWE